MSTFKSYRLSTEIYYNNKKTVPKQWEMIVIILVKDI